MLLSVVIVARNEEENIERCIKSILRETKGISKVEVLMVDSASTDQTVEIAKNYSINIIQLKSDWPLSPSAGRFSGVNNTTGKYVLIIDGDMELLAGWVNKALEFLDGNSKCAAVMGKSYNIYRNQEKPSLDRYAKRIGRTKNKLCSAVVFFRRICLEEVGNFHPFCGRKRKRRFLAG